MPYASKAQAAKFHADPSLRKYTAEYDQATKAQAGGFKALPQHVKAAASKRLSKQ